MSQAPSSSAIPAEGVIGSRPNYTVRTSAAPSSVEQQQQQSAVRAQKRYRADLGPGGFRSQSHFLVDRNPLSRENVMRGLLEELLEQTFVKVRPAFLLNPASKRKLELDAFSETLRLGVEFDGEQVRERSSTQAPAGTQTYARRSPACSHVFSTTPFPMHVIPHVKTLRSNNTATG